MIDKAISAASIQSMLQTLRSHQAQAAGQTADLSHATDSAQSTRSVNKPGFSEMVSGALSQVNEMQVQSRGMQTAFERGENIALSDVVLGMQKSSLAFEATLQVRNKVLKAYEDIMNMPV